jgi:hypothetical protein
MKTRNEAIWRLLSPPVTSRHVLAMQRVEGSSPVICSQGRIRSARDRILDAPDWRWRAALSAAVIVFAIVDGRSTCGEFIAFFLPPRTHYHGSPYSASGVRNRSPRRRAPKTRGAVVFSASSSRPPERATLARIPPVEGWV